MTFLIKHWLLFFGIAAGALSGYLYYAKIGCISGGCAITSDPIHSTLYGALLGGLFLSLLQSEKKQ